MLSVKKKGKIMKNKKMKRAVLMAIVTTMTMGFLAGCGQKGDSESQPVSNGNNDNESTVSVGQGENSTAKNETTGSFRDELPDDFKITIMVQDFEGSPNSGEYGEKIHAKLEEITGYNFEIVWVPSSGYTDKVSTVLAGGESSMPLIMKLDTQSGVVVSAAAKGAFWPLEDYLYDSEAYPYISQARKEIEANFTIGGHTYGLHNLASAIGRNGLGYRADWAEALGIAEPKTVDDVYNMLYAFTYGDPDGNGKKDTYGLNLCSSNGPLNLMQTWFGCGQGWTDNGEGNLVPVHMTEEYREALKWFKKLYDDGLVASDFPIRETGTWKNDNYNGIAGAYASCLDDVRIIWDYFVENDIPSVLNDGNTASMNMVAGISLDGNNPRTVANVSRNFFMVTKAAKSEAEVQACLDFLDKLCCDEALMLIDYGWEGVNWELNEAGDVVRINTDDNVLSKSYVGLNQMAPYIPNRYATNYTYDEDERVKMQNAKWAEGAEIAVFNPALGYLVNSETYLAQGGSLQLILDDARIQYIVGEIDDKGLEDAFNLWYSSGGEQLMKEVNDQYHADNSR
ncbi:MAG: extracellular solute-binding protein [Lachnospiraceae bacterium]|nr:extracellular solute-binding protein [Lachnospiraceae bacterium]